VEAVVKLNWLPVSKTVELNILKLSHKSLHDESFPECLKLNLHSIAHRLFYFGRIKYVSAASIFNKLPVAIRNTNEYKSFCRSVKRHFLSFIY